MEYVLHLLVLVTIYMILAEGFNLSFGLGRLFNLAHVACYALGAYSAAILSTQFQWTVFPALFASASTAVLLSLIIGLVSLRLSEDYFAIGSLAFAALVHALLVNWKELTHGVLGIPGIPRPVILGTELVDTKSYLTFSTFVMIGVLGVLLFLFRCRFGRELRAQGESERAAQALGIAPHHIRTLAFAVSAAIAGLAGALFAYYLQYIDPSSFTLTEMFFVLTIVVVGRPGSFLGCLLATIFVVLLPEPLRFVDIPSSILGPMRQALYALLLFGIVYWKKESIFPSERRI